MQTNNNNKLRKALSEILGIVDHVQMRFEIPKLANQEISELKQIAEAALAGPPRNCDVGTPEEQRKRFGEFCQSHSWHEIDGEHCRASCPLYHGDKAPCDELEWEQMPYTESEATDGE